MILEGTILDGCVKLDTPAALPDGTRVRLMVGGGEDWPDDLEPPPATETREEFLQSLRDSVAESQAGVRGTEARQFMKELAAKHGLDSLPED